MSRVTINNGGRMRTPPPVIPLHNRRGLFNDPTAVKFLGPILSFWATLSGEPSSKDLLAVEREAVLAVGVEKDLGNLATCRRKALEGLGSENREEYVNFLTTLGACYRKEKEFEQAKRLLQAINLVEPGNWPVKAELGIIYGLEGRLELSIRFFAEADMVFEQYDREYGVEAAERWEVSCFRARFEALAAIEKAEGIDQAKLAKILGPVLTFPDGLELNDIKQFFYQKFERTFIALLQSKAPLELFFDLFYRGIEGEKDGAIVMTLGEWPVNGNGNRSLKRSQMVVLETLAKTDNPLKATELKQLFGPEKVVEAKLAVTIFTQLRMRNLIAEERVDAARTVWQEVKSAKLISARTVRILRGELRVGTARLRQGQGLDRTAALIQRLDVLQEVGNEGKLIAEYQDVAREAKSILASAEVETRDIVRETLVGFIGFSARGEKTVKGAVLLAQEVIGFANGTAEEIKAIFVARFEDEGFCRAVKQLLSANDKFIKRVAQEVIDGKHAPGYTVKNGKIPRLAEVRREESFRDFFFVRLAEVAALQRMAGEIEFINAELSSVATDWPFMLSLMVEKESLKRKLLAKVKGKKLARLEHYRKLVTAGQIHGVIDKAKKIMESTDNPVIIIRALCLYSMVLIREINRKEPAKNYLTDAAFIAEKGEEAYSIDRFVGPVKDLMIQDWSSTLLNVAQLYALVKDYDAAHKHYRRSFEVKGYYKDALEGMVATLLFQGKDFELASYLIDFMGKVKAGAVDFAIKDKAMVALYLAEAFFQNRDYKNALMFINSVARGRTAIDAHLLKARILLMEKGVEAAKKRLGIADGIINESVGRMDRENVKQIRAYRELALGDILGKENKWEEAAAAFRRAINMFPKDFEIGHRVLDAKWALIDCLSTLAAKKEDGEIFEKALREATKFVKESPFFPPAHQAIIGPLIHAGREQEALEHLNWLADRVYGVAPHAFGNLLLLYLAGEGGVKEEAGIIMEKIKRQLPEKAYQALHEDAVLTIRALRPDLAEEYF